MANETVDTLGLPDFASAAVGVGPGGALHAQSGPEALIIGVPTQDSAQLGGLGGCLGHGCKEPVPNGWRAVHLGHQCDQCEVAVCGALS